jgi:hypothetical protein
VREVSIVARCAAEACLVTATPKELKRAIVIQIVILKRTRVPLAA